MKRSRKSPRKNSLRRSLPRKRSVKRSRKNGKRRGSTKLRNKSLTRFDPERFLKRLEKIQGKRQIIFPGVYY